MKLICSAQINRSTGSVLFEALLALLIFGVVAVALTRSLSTLGTTALEVGREAELRSRSHALLWEYGFVSEIESAEITVPESSSGEKFSIVIAPAELQNRDGVALSDLYRVAVKCQWQESGVSRELSVDTLRYAPLYR